MSIQVQVRNGRKVVETVSRRTRGTNGSMQVRYKNRLYSVRTAKNQQLYINIA